MEPESQDLMVEIRDALYKHDRKVDLVASDLSHSSERVAASAERIEASITNLSNQLIFLVPKGNGRGGNLLDLAMKVILILVGILAIVTIGADKASKLVVGP